MLESLRLVPMRIVVLLLSVALLLSCAWSAEAQQKTPSSPAKQEVKPTDPSKLTQPVTVDDQDPIRISTEEIQLSVAAFDSYGRLDPSVQRDDILLLEDGVPQEIRSARRIPANVILLLDTGGEINSAKRVAVTREVATSLVNSLAIEDQISVMQFNSKVELLVDWTSGPRSIIPAL